MEPENASQENPQIHRFPGEGDNAFAAFQFWIHSGWDFSGPIPRRVARSTALAILRTQTGEVDAWFSMFAWSARADAWDSAFLARVELEVRGASTRAFKAIATAVEVAVSSIPGEIERTLEKQRKSGGTIPLRDLAKVLADLTSVLKAIAPPEKTGGMPVIGESPEDSYIAETAGALSVVNSSGEVVP